MKQNTGPIPAIKSINVEPELTIDYLADMVEELEAKYSNATFKTEMLENGVMQLTFYSKNKVTGMFYLGEKAQKALEEKIREGLNSEQA